MAVRTPGRLELAILDVLWDEGPSTARQVLEQLSAEPKPAYNTVLTVLRRMEQKEMLKREKVSHSHVYAAAIDRNALRSGLLRDLLARLFDDSPGEMVAHLVKERKISAKDLTRIEALLAQHRGRKKPG